MPEPRTPWPHAPLHQLSQRATYFVTAGTYLKAHHFRGHDRLRVLPRGLLTVAPHEVGAIFAYLNRRLDFTLHAIVDTAGKSLHGRFDAPRNKVFERRLKAALTVFGCDPKLFTYPQPVRVPGAWRDGKLQRLIWLRN